MEQLGQLDYLGLLVRGQVGIFFISTPLPSLPLIECQSCADP